MIRKIFNKKVITILIIFTIAFLGFKWPTSSYVKKENFSNYDSYIVKKGVIKITVLTTGTVQPQNRLSIKPPIAGRVEEILVNEGDNVQKGELLAWMSSSERAALLDAARAKSKNELKKWQEYYKPTPIYAPIDGTVILRAVEPGQTFANQESVFILSDRLVVKAQVDETDLGNIKIGQETNILLDSYSNDKIKGKVVHIAFDSTTVNNVTTYLVDVEPQDSSDIMRSGMTANVTFYIKEKANLLTVPESAIKYKDGLSFVEIKNEKNEIIKKKVAIGDSDDENVEIKSGLNEGDKILIEKNIISTNENKKRSPFMPMGRR
ncbi:MAG: efflux RND transporter periplasmic adaptor subunit [Bdellovibrionota bacterium]